MKPWNAIALLCFTGLLVAAGLAWGVVVAEGQVSLTCPGATCTLDLGAGHWIIRTPPGQTVDTQETDNETRYRIETPRQQAKP